MIEIKRGCESQDVETSEPDLDSITDSIIEDDLKNFEIVENESNNENEETEIKTEISEETAKIKDLLESIILVMLFIISMRHKNIENKQKVVMDFVNERKESINRICVCMEKTIARNAELYKKVQKANDVSFLIQLVILTLEFEGVLNEMEKKQNGQIKIKEVKNKGKENKEVKEQNLQSVGLTETGKYAEAW